MSTLLADYTATTVQICYSLCKKVSFDTQYWGTSSSLAAVLAMGYGAAVLGPRTHDANKSASQDTRSGAEKHCQKLACRLGACAQKNVYNQSKCDGQYFATRPGLGVAVCPIGCPCEM